MQDILTTTVESGVYVLDGVMLAWLFGWENIQENGASTTVDLERCRFTLFNLRGGDCELGRDEEGKEKRSSKTGEHCREVALGKGT